MPGGGKPRHMRRGIGRPDGKGADPLLEELLARADAELDDSVARLFELLKIQSISTDPGYASECARAADHMAADLRSIGFDASTRPTEGHPMVVAHAAGSGPRYLFYGHYDVQPVDPLELWNRDPFDPAIEETGNGKVIRGRGACDDKGQLMTFVEACRAWKREFGEAPRNISVLLEGEEESASPSLVPFLEANADELKADAAIICDTGQFGDDTPAIVTMLRGLLAEEVEITGPDKDLHSGLYGGIAMNPARVLARVIADLHNADGSVVVPGFYDGVAELPDSIREQWQDLRFDHGEFLGAVGLSQPAGEQDRMPLEMAWSRPTCEVNGLDSGYSGEGFKTVLPSAAKAKISFRLVGGQDPLAIRKNFREFVRERLPEDCSAEFTGHGASPASRMDTSHPIFEMCRGALAAEWGKPAVFAGCGGSIPIAGHFQDILGIDSLLVGFGKDDDQIHSPNEKYDLESFRKGIRSWVRMLAALKEAAG